jgi:hypothetical protein
MEELLATLDAYRKKDLNDKKFQAAIQGVDVDGDASETEDITKMKGFRAQQDGFGVGLGLGHVVEESN